jgi:hypothetical protein
MLFTREQARLPSLVGSGAVGFQTERSLRTSNRPAPYDIRPTAIGAQNGGYRASG